MSSAEAWLEWGRRKAAEAEGLPLDHVEGKTPVPVQAGGNNAGTRPPSGERQGKTGREAAFAESQGNSESWRGTRGDGYGHRRPDDPWWRKRTAHRTSTRAATRALLEGRQRRGWSQLRAEDETGVSHSHISLLERGLRRPSESVAETLISAYQLTGADADAVRGIAVPWAGRDSPYRTGVAPGGDWEP
jgi:hypothetical protein